MPKKRTIGIIFIIVILLVLLILALREMVLYNQKMANFENKTYNTLADFETVEEVAKYLDCVYIKEEPSTTSEYDTDIYVTFKYDLYTDGAANQEYFYSAAILFEQVTNFGKIRIIDASKDLVIAIKGDSKQQKIVKMYINGKENYFGEKDTVQALEDYKETAFSKIDIQSKILKELISKDWKAKEVDFGTQESTLDGYDIYFDEGIEIRKIGTKIFNIVFTEKYQDEIINGIKVNEEPSKIEEQLGKPSYGEINQKTFGYKSNKIYIFFETNRVSIYPVQDDNNEQQFLTLVNDFRETSDIKKFVNNLTDLWPDYDVYEYDEDYVNLVYTLRGLKVQINTQRDNGIIFYNNYRGSYISNLRENIENLPRYTYFVDSDLVWENEKNNYYSVHNYEYEKNEYYYEETDSNLTVYSEGGVLKYRKYSNKFFVSILWGKGKIAIISTQNTKAPIEIEGLINSYFWIDDDNLIFTIKNKGMFSFNAETNEMKTIIEGNEEFDIKDYQNGVIYYDDKNIIYNLANIGMDSYIWLTDSILAYSKKNQGIYIYNILTQATDTVIEGTDEFYLVKYENGRIYYDNKNVFYILT